LLRHDFAAFAGFDLAVYFYQTFGDQRLGCATTVGPTLMFDKVTQGNEGVAFEQKRLHGKSSRWMNADYSRAAILGS
jgi:hypothetical protein